MQGVAEVFLLFYTGRKADKDYNGRCSIAQTFSERVYLSPYSRWFDYYYVKPKRWEEDNVCMSLTWAQKQFFPGGYIIQIRI